MSFNRMVGGTLLIAGTALGAGMLALPVETATLGFRHTLVLFVLSWSFMTLSALLLLEISLHAAAHSNLLRMAEQFLGKTGHYIALISYLLLMYALCAAYLSGLTDWLLEGGLSLLSLEIPHSSAALLASMLIGACIVFGVWVVDHINRLFMFGLGLSFITLLVLVAPSVQLPLLMASSKHLDLSKLALIVTAFGFHIVIPSLVSYLGPDRAKLSKVIWFGSLLPLSFYLLWQGLVMGSLPLEGSEGLLQLQQAGHPSAGLTLGFYQLTHSPYIATTMRAFAFFALITSFLGVALSLFDCLHDTCRMKSTIYNRLLVAGFTLFPPLLFTLFFPAGFVLALYLAGIFVALLLGILPAVMVYSARYRLKRSTWRTFAGQKPVLGLVIMFFVGVIIIELKRLL